MAIYEIPCLLNEQHDSEKVSFQLKRLILGIK